MSDSDRFKHDYHKYVDDQVRNRQHDEAMGRLRMAFFVGVLGPGSAIIMHTIGYDPANVIRYAMQGTAVLAIILLVINFARLPGKAKSSPTAISVLLFTLLAVAATYPLARIFSLTPR